MLKLCPFCGRKAILQREYYKLSEDEAFYVECEECGGQRETREEAVNAWNKRAGSKMELIEKLEALIEKWENVPYTGDLTKAARSVCANELREVIGSTSDKLN